MSNTTRYDEKLESIGYDVIHPQEATPGNIEAYEAAIGATLPGDYREFVLKYGVTGLGEDGYVYCAMKEDCSWGELMTDVFYGFLPGDTYDLRETFDSYRGRMPANLVPVACDPGGNQVVLSVNGSDRGKVYFWDHEHRELGGFERVSELYEELERAGVDTSRLDSDRAILRWEEMNRAELSKPPGYGNVYLLADTFAEFIDRLRYEPDDGDETE